MHRSLSTNNISPDIIQIPEFKVVGIHRKMSIGKNVTYELFHAFMPRRNEVENRSDKKIIDLRVYAREYFISFNPTNTFIKWACVRVSQANNLPDKMDYYFLHGGLYARFTAPDHPTNPSEVFGFIFNDWLPKSRYQLDHRPHFDILNERERNDQSPGTQLIHIPIVEKR